MKEEKVRRSSIVDLLRVWMIDKSGEAHFCKYIDLVTNRLCFSNDAYLTKSVLFLCVLFLLVIMTKRTPLLPSKCIQTHAECADGHYSPCEDHHVLIFAHSIRIFVVV